MTLRTLLVYLSPRWKTLIFSLYWLASAVVISSIVFYSIIPWEKFMEARSYYLTFAFGLFFSKALIVLFLLADDIRRAIVWIYGKFRSAPEVAAVVDGNRETEGISRSQFLMKTGFLIGGTMLGT